MSLPKHITQQFQKGGRGIWSDIPEAQWTDWKWQMQNRITDLQTLQKALPLTTEEVDAVRAGEELFKIGITPYYLSQVTPDDPACPVRYQCVPRMGEMQVESWDMEDPLGEEKDMPVQGVTHRYPDRALLYITQNCAMFCRHCTRKRKVADPSTAANEQQLQECIDYISKTPSIRDVIISGGDPLTFGNDKLEKILQKLRAIPHVQILRLGTRTPVTLPQRITPELVQMLQRYQPLYINTHFNHPKECTQESFKACKRLADAGFPIGNQMVLLKGVNDTPETVLRLNHLLLMMRVKPYYIYMCDLAKGISHFRTTLDTGLEIMEHLRGWTSGLAVPYLVIDAPGGGGKIPVLPNYLLSREPGKIHLRNFKNNEYTYHEPIS